MKSHPLLAISLTFFVSNSFALADVARSETNSGNLVMEDIPAIPQSVIANLNRYQNVRSAGFQAWTEDGEGMFVTTRFGDVSQIHHVGHAGGAPRTSRQTTSNS
jgi:hypothetical protein